MTKKVAILQSNYIPWKGYFDLINMVDEFVLYDEVQYTKNDWRNRNLIQTAQGLKWLTIPVRQEKLQQTIQDTQIADKRWGKKHWASMSQNYAKASYFNEYKDVFEWLYLGKENSLLSEVNRSFIERINDILGISTNIRLSSEFSYVEGKTERLLGICQDCGATEYISGPSAQGYLDTAMFEAESIKVRWMDYTGYRCYKQLFSPFEHGVSVLDLIFNEGPNAKKYMLSFKENI